MYLLLLLHYIAEIKSI